MLSLFKGVIQLSIDNQYAVELKDVTIVYGNLTAVKSLTLSLRQGEIFALLGPNGSGKTTTLKMLMGLLAPTQGEVNVLGYDLKKDALTVKQLVGYVPDSPNIYNFLTGIEYLDFIGDIYGVGVSEKKQRITEYLKALQLDGREGDMINSYSDGMKKKISLISAFLHKPKLLILDEPLNALDPRSAKIVKNYLHELKSQGVTTILSTHVLEIAQAVCDRIGIMYQGHLLALGNMDELRQKASLPNSQLEDIFLKLTGTDDLRAVVEELVK
jgi:ABC-2 type transport system ATP-binding protein